MTTFGVLRRVRNSPMATAIEIREFPEWAGKARNEEASWIITTWTKIIKTVAI